MRQNTDADRILTIAEQGFEGHLYDAIEKEKVVITFSGSEGGSSTSDTMAYYYRQNGISALGVTLFAGIDTGKFLDKVPLEYVENAIRYLKDQGYKKIAVDGISKGSEYALLAASMFEDISCVIARVPSYFVSEGMIGEKRTSGDSCWSYQRKGLNYVPYKIKQFNVIKQFIAHREFNILDYNTNKDIGSEAIIPMERIQGPILLISTEADTVWPSVQQADYIKEYLLDHNFSYEIMNLKYQYISHFAIPMRRNEGLLKLLFKTERKYPNECAADRADITSKVIDFIQNHW